MSWLRFALAATVVSTVLLFPAPAHAQAPGNDDSSALDQYVEEVPTGEGSTPVASGQGGTPPPPQPPPGAPAEAAESAIVETITTSPAYGAPQKKLRAVPNARAYTHDPDAGGAAAATPSLEPLSAAVSAVQGGDRARLAGLIGVCLLISVAAVAGALRRHRHAPTSRRTH